MSDASSAPTHDWNGDSGDRWAANLARLDLMLQDFGDAAIAAADAKPGEHILDSAAVRARRPSHWPVASDREDMSSASTSPNSSSRSRARRRPRRRRSSSAWPMPRRGRCPRGASTFSSRASA